MLATALLSAAACLAVYLHLLSKRLSSSQYKRSTPFPSDEKLIEDASKWRDIDVLAGTGVESATGKRYLVTGGCGNVGSTLVGLLHRRGERQIFVLDVAPLPNDLAGLEGITFIKTDISSRDSVDTAFKQARPDVIFHLASLMRYYERLAYTYSRSEPINVQGTRNLVEATKALSDTESEKIFVYCSSAGTCVPNPYYMRLGFSRSQKQALTIRDGQVQPGKAIQTAVYTVSKAASEALVVRANGVGGMKTGILRPGMAIMGPTDLYISQMLRTSNNPYFTEKQTHNTIGNQDLAAAHCLYEKALRERASEVGGDAFLITGDTDPWNHGQVRHTVQLLANRDCKFIAVSPTILYVISHMVEVIAYLRYQLLSITNSQVAPYPSWMVGSKLHLLQPAMWGMNNTDAIIDDTRARKMLGYRNKFSNAQTIQWIIDTMKSSEPSNKGANAKSEPFTTVLPPVPKQAESVLA